LEWKEFNGMLWIQGIARCVLQAIQYLHTAGYVHQDIQSGNVFASMAKNEMNPADTSVITFKLGDLGVAQLHKSVGLHNVRPNWIHLPEILKPEEFGPIDSRLDIYLVGLLLLQIALSKPLTFTEEETLAGKPRQMAEELPAPYNFALGKCLRRHVQYRTANAMEVWRDLRVPSASENRGSAAPMPAAKAAVP
jgi:serine/threonine protein kinase